MTDLRKEEKMKSLKDVLGSVLIGIFVGVIIFEVIFALNLFKNGNTDQNINVEIENGETEVVEFEKLGLVPGDKTEYTLIITTKDTIAQTIQLNFYETQDSPLKDFVRVKILIEDEEVYDGLLGDAMDGDAIDTDTSITAGGECRVTIVYYMPEEVGNEAEGAEAWFKLYITAQYR